ncbi:MAG: glycosyltransferase [Syntrophomonadaceae bacterium]|nr:glycosyltransferase [Syntrophomonadaceae bacterium]
MNLPHPGKKHSVHVVECPAGGVLTYLVNMCKALKDKSVKVTVIYSIRPDTPENFKELFPSGIQFIYLSMCREISILTDTMSLIKLIKVIKKLNPDIVHLHSSKAGFLGRVACCLAAVSAEVFYTPHGFSFLRTDVSKVKRLLYRKIELLGARFGGKIVASSLAEQEQAKQIVKEPELIEHCVDICNESNIQNIFSDKGPVIISVGRLSNAKNPLEFVRICNLIKQSLPEASFVWVGDGDLKQQFIEESEKLKVNIEITGWLSTDEVYTFLSNSDIYVHTALWEAWPPYSVLEAAAFGLPIVFKEINGVTDDQGGYFVGGVDEKEIAAGILNILKDGTEYQLQSEKSKQLIAKYYSFERFDRQISILYGI